MISGPWTWEHSTPVIWKRMIYCNKWYYLTHIFCVIESLVPLVLKIVKVVIQGVNQKKNLFGITCLNAPCLQSYIKIQEFSGERPIQWTNSTINNVWTNWLKINVFLKFFLHSTGPFVVARFEFFFEKTDDFAIPCPKKGCLHGLGGGRHHLPRPLSHSVSLYVW